MTPEQLSTWTSTRIDRARTHTPALNAAMAEFEINTPARQAAFLAQVMHETAALRWLSELWGPTAAQAGYEGRKDLGNTQIGDGHRFRGRGDIMITGRDNYSTYGALLGVDLITFPDRASEPELGARIAGLYWTRNQINVAADAGDFDGVCDLVNLGRKTARIGDSNGYADRLGYWIRLKSGLRV